MSLVCDPTARAASAVLSAVQVLLHHPGLTPYHVHLLRGAALGVATALPIPARDPELRSRLDRCREAIELCGCQLGLVEPVLAALSAVRSMRTVVQLHLATSASRIPAPPPTLEPAALAS